MILQGALVCVLSGPSEGGGGEEPGKLELCSRKWVKMTDRNYLRALSHYSECASLAHQLAPNASTQYRHNIIANMKKTCNYFFDRSRLPDSTLIGVLREVTKILEGLDDKTISQPKSQRHYDDQSSVYSGMSGRFPGRCAVAPPQQTTPKPKSSCVQQARSQSRVRKTTLLLWGLFWLIVFTVIVQLLFILWLFCIAACMGFISSGENNQSDNSGDELKRDGGYSKHLKRNLDTRPSPAQNRKKNELLSSEPSGAYLAEAELSSLSSENISSDVELEALLTQRKLARDFKNKGPVERDRLQDR